MVPLFLIFLLAGFLVIGNPCLSFAQSYKFKDGYGKDVARNSAKTVLERF